MFYWIDLGRFEEAKRRSLTLRHLFDRYADCLVAQICQSVACNAAHSIEQRAAKWLLAAAARTGTCDLARTQEELAAMLAVGRSHLNRVMGGLRKRAEMFRRVSWFDLTLSLRRSGGNG